MLACSVLDEHQCVDQAGFRPGVGRTHHLFTVAMVQEKRHEWQQCVWISAIDFQKAFDSVQHSCIWEALERQGAPGGYVRLLKNLYSGQSGRVRTDRLSKEFDILRGTKQGDPLSSLLFNAVLEDVFAEVKPSWEKKGWGLRLGYSKYRQLTNLRFADDVLLIGTSLRQLKQMLIDLKEAAMKRGLLLHPGKTKILSNATKRAGRPKDSHVKVGNMNIEVVPYEGKVKYLGRQVSFDRPHDVEVEHRINMAWTSFMAQRDELTNKRYSLNARLRLFDATVSNVFLYGSTTWVLTQELTDRVRRVQRKMLRMILGSRRRQLIEEGSSRGTSSMTSDSNSLSGDPELEPWVDWLHRTARELEERCRKLHVRDWVEAHRNAASKWLGQLQEGKDSWARRALEWELFGRTRRAARPRSRWADSWAYAAPPTPCGRVVVATSGCCLTYA